MKRMKFRLENIVNQIIFVVCRNTLFEKTSLVAESLLHTVF